MRSIDLLCPCSTPNTTEDLKATTDAALIEGINAALIEGINATLKEVADSITASNADIKDALNNCYVDLGKKAKIDEPTLDEPTNNK